MVKLFALNSPASCSGLLHSVACDGLSPLLTSIVFLDHKVNVGP